MPVVATILEILWTLVLVLVAAFTLYVAARIVTRAVVFTLMECGILPSSHKTDRSNSNGKDE